VIEAPRQLLDLGVDGRGRGGRDLPDEIANACATTSERFGIPCRRRPSGGRPSHESRLRPTSGDDPFHVVAGRLEPARDRRGSAIFSGWAAILTAPAIRAAPTLSATPATVSAASLPARRRRAIASEEAGMATRSEARARDRMRAVMSSPVSAEMIRTRYPSATLREMSWSVTKRRSLFSYSFRFRYLTISLRRWLIVKKR
jgi:hypothetical protein